MEINLCIRHRQEIERHSSQNLSKFLQNNIIRNVGHGSTSEIKIVFPPPTKFISAAERMMIFTEGVILTVKIVRSQRTR